MGGHASPAKVQCTPDWHTSSCCCCRVCLSCTSSALYHLGKQDAVFFRTVSVQLAASTASATSKFLAARRHVIRDLRLYEVCEEGSKGAALQQLAGPGAALTSLEWAVFRPEHHFRLGDLHLPHLRRLHLSMTEGAAGVLTIHADFSGLASLQELRVEALWPRVTLQDSCLPPSLTSLHLSPQLETGYLPPVLAAATQLRRLRLALPENWATGQGLGELRNLTHLELWRAPFLESQLCALTQLESLALWAPSHHIQGTHLAALAPLTRLTSLGFYNARWEGHHLPHELGDLRALRELVITPWLLVGDGCLEALEGLTLLTRLELPGAHLPALPPQLAACLPALEELDLGG